MTQEPDLPRTKAGLIERMATARAALEAHLRALTAEQMTTPGPDGWSVKDHLAHLTAWEQTLPPLLRGESRAAALGVSEQVFRSGDEDAINAAIYERAKDLPLDEVLDRFRRSRAEVLALVERMDQEDLERPFSHYQPNDAPFNATPIAAWIIGNTFGHDEDHLRWIEDLVARL